MPASSSSLRTKLVLWFALVFLAIDAGLVAALIEVFEEDRASLFATLDDAVANGEAEAIARAAHTIKGALGVFAAEASRSRAEHIERMARNGALDELGDEVGALHREVEELTSELATFLGELRPG